MSAADKGLAIVVRECDERTAPACVALLQEIFPGHDIHRVSARPFSATLRLSLEKGLAAGRAWTLCIDADVLALPELPDLLREARQSAEHVFEIQGLVYDKLMMAPRAAGNHLYRTRLLEQALSLIPTEHSLRPETDMIDAMADLGYPWRQSRAVVGLHDFEQSYADIYAKAALHARKHRYLLPLYRPLWQMLAVLDDDYRVALLALDDDASRTGQPAASRSEYEAEAAGAAARLQLAEKPPLAVTLSPNALHSLQAASVPTGEAGILSRRIASLTERWILEQGHALPPRDDAALTSDPRPLAVLVCANAYPQFDVCAQSVGGGMEVRAALFARGLAAGDRWRVKFVVGDFGQPFETRLEGIDFHIYQPTYRKAGRNVFPRLHKRRWFPALNLDRRDLDLLWQIPLIAAWLALPSLFFPRFWRSLQPDLVCCFGNNALSAEVIADCQRAGIRTALCIASDKDISADYRPGNRERNHHGMPKWKGHYSVANADCIIVQTEAQREALRQRFGREAALVRNPVHVSPEDPQYWLPRRERAYVLWIGRTDDYNKRPMLFLELARACPGIDCVMIVSRTDNGIFSALQRSCPTNLRIIEHVPSHEIWDYLRRARVFVNTSEFEGFPNTFLQSAVTGVPIVSLNVDPDSMLSRHGCGICADGDAESLKAAVLHLWEDDVRADELAGNCLRYALEQHKARARVAELTACFDSCLGAPKPASHPWWTIYRRLFSGRVTGRGDQT